MNDVRHDPVTGRVVIMAAGRATRPHTLAQAQPDEDRGPEHCPFCPGHESETPPEVLRTGEGDAGAPGWRVQVFPNLYPITDTHEVVVFSPDHYRTFADLSDDAATEVAIVLRDRVRVHSMPASRSAPRSSTRAGRRGRRSRTRTRRCSDWASCRPTSQPRSTASWWRPTTCWTTTSPMRDRGLVLADGEVATWCPFASRRLLVRLCHADPGATFDAATDAEIAAVAIAARRARRAAAGRRPCALQRGRAHGAALVHRDHAPPQRHRRIRTGHRVFVNTVPPEHAVGFSVESDERDRHGLHDDRRSTSGRVVENIEIAHRLDEGRGADHVQGAQHRRWCRVRCLTRVGPLFTTDRFVVTQWRPGELMGIEHRGAVTGDADSALNLKATTARASAGKSGSGFRGGSAASSANGWEPGTPPPLEWERTAAAQASIEGGSVLEPPRGSGAPQVPCGAVSRPERPGEKRRAESGSGKHDDANNHRRADQRRERSVRRASPPVWWSDYTQTEYFLAGTADAYELGSDGVGQGGRYRRVPASSCTALPTPPLQRHRPRQWLNVSGGVDSSPDWTFLHREMMRSGYAWWASRRSRSECTVVRQSWRLPADGTHRGRPRALRLLSHPGDTFSFDIYAQAGAVRAASKERCSPSSRWKRVVRSVNRNRRSGSPPTSTPSIPLHRCTTASSCTRGSVGLAPRRERAHGDPSAPPEPFRDDLRVPVLCFEAETDLMVLDYLPARQPDNDKFRLWEVAGTAHADVYTFVAGFIDSGVADRRARRGVEADDGAARFRSRAPAQPRTAALRAPGCARALRSLAGRRTPPRAPRLECPTTTRRSSPSTATARGGIRTPHVDVPIAVLSGMGNDGAPIAHLRDHRAIQRGEARVYSSKADYCARFDAATDAAVAAGWLLEADAPEIKAIAAELYPPVSEPASTNVVVGPAADAGCG
jgi:hypothetical protein